jgi:hypothetical protein
MCGGGVACQRYLGAAASPSARPTPPTTCPRLCVKPLGRSTTARAAAASASPAACGRRGRNRPAATRDGNGGQQLHRVVVALRTRRGHGSLPHRAADLEGVATGAAPVLVSRHGLSVGPGSDTNASRCPGYPQASTRPLQACRCRVMSIAWRRSRKNRWTGPSCAPRRRTGTVRSAAPARLRPARATRRVTIRPRSLRPRSAGRRKPPRPPRPSRLQARRRLRRSRQPEWCRRLQPLRIA